MSEMGATALVATLDQPVQITLWFPYSSPTHTCARVMTKSSDPPEQTAQVPDVGETSLKQAGSSVQFANFLDNNRWERLAGPKI